jgi:CheY-like chemotaxis protein
MNKPLVLLVEESPIARNMLRLALESEGCTVIEADGGEAAIEAAAQSRPDFLLLGQVLPGKQAPELLAEIRARTGEPALPALVVSGAVSRLDELNQIARKVMSALNRR